MGLTKETHPPFFGHPSPGIVVIEGTLADFIEPLPLVQKQDLQEQ